ncbi:MAG: hypothetical protein LBR15_11105 [Methanobrevibacter sp.]|jgi:hypothetical protein|nr:hypothetical protein [Candidatus Methanovirga australis]
MNNKFLVFILIFLLTPSLVIGLSLQEGGKITVVQDDNHITREIWYEHYDTVYAFNGRNYYPVGVENYTCVGISQKSLNNLKLLDVLCPANKGNPITGSPINMIFFFKRVNKMDPIMIQQPECDKPWMSW